MDFFKHYIEANSEVSLYNGYRYTHTWGRHWPRHTQFSITLGYLCNICTMIKWMHMIIEYAKNRSLLILWIITIWNKIDFVVSMIRNLKLQLKLIQACLRRKVKLCNTRIILIEGPFSIWWIKIFLHLSFNAFLKHTRT